MRNKTPKIPKGPWMNAADIYNDTYFMKASVCMSCIRDWPRWGLGDKVKYYLNPFKEGYTQMLYLRKEFNQETNFLLKKIINKKGWVEKVFKGILDNSKKLFVESRKLRVMNFRKMTKTEIIKAFKKVYKYQILSHSKGAAVSWMVEAEEEKFTKYVLDRIERQMKIRRLKLIPAEVFSVLSTPLRPSFSEREEKEFLEIGLRLSRNKEVVKLFLKQEIKSLSDKIFKGSPKLFKDFDRHYKKWCWTPYMYTGPAYDFDYYLMRMRDLINKKTNFEKELKDRVRKRKDLIKREHQYLNLLKPDIKLKRLIKIAQEMAYVKVYRKDALYHAMYCYEPMFKEIGRRNYLTYQQILQLTGWEIIEILRGKKFNAEELNQRRKLSCFYLTPTYFSIFLGKKAERILKMIRMEKVKTRGVIELKGTCASPGKARGKVRIINLPKEIKKMNHGDVIISHTTNPDLLPAMKKASAIITEAGGLTCHAAVVAREFKIPCVVGTLIAGKVFKDGDKVEVNATKGIVKKI